MSRNTIKANRDAIAIWCTEGFAKMPLRIARAQKLTARDKLVFAVLVSRQFFTPRTRGIFPDIADLAYDCSMSERGIRRSLHYLRYGHRDLDDNRVVDGWTPLIQWTTTNGRRRYALTLPTKDVLDRLSK